MKDMYSKTLDFFVCFYQSRLPELDNPLSKKVRSIISSLLEKRPNSMKVKYFSNKCNVISTHGNLMGNFST